MAGPYTAFTYGDLATVAPAVHAYGPLVQNHPWWMAFTFAPGTQYAAYSQRFSLGGAFTLTVTVASGSLPTGLVLSDVGSAPGMIWQVAGVPTAAGTFAFSLRATNAYGYMDESFSITIGAVSAAPPYWPSFTFSSGVVGQAYGQSFTSNGNTPITITLQSGSLPTGLSLSLVSGSTYQISGTPSAAGTFSFTLRATNTYGTADASYSIVIVSAGGGSFCFAG